MASRNQRHHYNLLRRLVAKFFLWHGELSELLMGIGYVQKLYFPK